MLDDGDRGIREIPHHRPGSLGVEEVVIGELQALPLFGAGHAAATRGAVEGRRLVRVLAVAKVADLVSAQRKVLGHRRDRSCAAEMMADRRVVRRRVRKRDSRQMAA